MVYIFFLIFIFFGCENNNYPSSFVLEKSGKNIFKELKEDYDLHKIRSFSNKNQMISRIVTDYFHNFEVDVMTARHLLHIAVEKYLEKIGENIELKPFLKNGNIGSENLECTIFFKKGLKDKNAITSVSLLDGIVRYNQIDLKDGTSKKILEEKYK